MPAIELDGYTHTFEEVADRDERKEQRLKRNTPLNPLSRGED